MSQKTLYILCGKVKANHSVFGAGGLGGNGGDANMTLHRTIACFIKLEASRAKRELQSSYRGFTFISNG